MYPKRSRDREGAVDIGASPLSDGRGCSDIDIHRSLTVAAPSVHHFHRLGVNDPPVMERSERCPEFFSSARPCLDDIFWQGLIFSIQLPG
jgi:hypothetical protein